MKTKKQTKKVVKEVSKKNNWKSMLNDLENTLEEFFTKKMPAFPDKAKEMIVQYGPYITVIMMIMTIPAILALLGVGALFTPFAFLGGITQGFSYIVALLFLLVTIGFELAALPALFKRQMKGWKILFYLSLVNAVSNLISFSLGSLIIGAGVSWYVLFQIKSYYK
jgi:hypothetical protein